MNKPKQYTKQKMVAAFDKDNFDFINFFKNPTNASKILFGVTKRAIDIKKNANYKNRYVDKYLFEWVDSETLDANTIAEVKKKLHKRKPLNLYSVHKQKNAFTVTIPKTIVKEMKLKEKDEFKISLFDGKIILEKYEALS